MQPGRSAAVLLVGMGCAPPSPCAHQEAVPLPAHQLALRWTADDPDAAAEVRYTLDGAEQVVQATPDGEDFTAWIPDLPPLTRIRYALWEGDRRVCEDEAETENTAQVSGLSVIESGAGASWERLALLRVGEDSALVVVDRQGQLRWHHVVQDEAVGVTAMQVEPGAGLRYNTLDPERARDLGTVQAVGWDGVPGAALRTPGAHHTFTLLPDGTVAFLAVDIRDWTDPATGTTEPVVGDALWEVAPDGTLRQVFTIWDHAEPAVHSGWDSGFYPEGRDWTHGNGVSYSAARDSYLISLGNIDTVYEIDRTTGAVKMKIDPVSWSVEGPVFGFPHAPSWTPEGTLLLFSYQGMTAGAIEYAVDAEARTREAVWWRQRDGITITFMGSARRLAGGNTLISYGAFGLLEEVTPAGAVVMYMRSGLGEWFGAADVVDGGYP